MELGKTLGVKRVLAFEINFRSATRPSTAVKLKSRTEALLSTYGLVGQHAAEPDYNSIQGRYIKALILRQCNVPLQK